jgi:hypothetical protein
MEDGQLDHVTGRFELEGGSADTLAKESSSKPTALANSGVMVCQV